MVAQEQKDLRIKQIQEALRYAEQAGVIKPQIQQTQDVTQDSMFLLGSDALKSMIEHESTRPLILSDNYFQTKQKLLDIENLKFEGAELHAYRYVMKPTLPIRRDSPKKSDYPRTGSSARWDDWCRCGAGAKCSAWLQSQS